MLTLDQFIFVFDDTKVTIENDGISLFYAHASIVGKPYTGVGSSTNEAFACLFNRYHLRDAMAEPRLAEPVPSGS